jgi:uncharacterized protein (DUF983 family)
VGFERVLVILNHDAPVRHHNPFFLPVSRDGIPCHWRTSPNPPSRARIPPNAVKNPVTLGRFLHLTGQALRLRCPRCGSRGLFRSYFSLQRTCPSCGLVLDRGEPDYWIGGYTVNFIAAEMLVSLVLLVVILVTWPDVPWDAVMYGGVGLAILVPILFYPMSKMLWLAWDYCFRPTDV